MVHFFPAARHPPSPPPRSLYCQGDELKKIHHAKQWEPSDDIHKPNIPLTQICVQGFTLSVFGHFSHLDHCIRDWPASPCLAIFQNGCVHETTYGYLVINVLVVLFDSYISREVFHNHYRQKNITRTTEHVSWCYFENKNIAPNDIYTFIIIRLLFHSHTLKVCSSSLYIYSLCKNIAFQPMWRYDWNARVPIGSRYVLLYF